MVKAKQDVDVLEKSPTGRPTSSPPTRLVSVPSNSNGRWDAVTRLRGFCCNDSDAPWSTKVAAH